MKRLVIFCDGASKGNPGPAAIGVSVLDEQGVEVFALSLPLGVATNNQAEYIAAIAGAQVALFLGADEVELRTDSQLLERQLAGRYLVRDEKLQELLTQLMCLMAKFRSWKTVHIPRGENKRADQLANAALREL